MAFKRIQIAYITAMTGTGGFIKTPISEMQAFSKESKVIFTDYKAERTSSRFLKESLPIA